MGQEFILVNINLDFKGGAASGEIKRAVDSLERQIEEAFPG